MPTSRLCGGTRVTSRSPNRISPLLGRMNPASTISSVVLPDPDGPRRVMNSPLAISRLTLSSAAVRPNVLVTSRIEIGREIVALFIDTPTAAFLAMRGGRASMTCPPGLQEAVGQRLLLHERVEALHHLIRVLDPPIHAQQEALADVLRRVGELGCQLFGDQPGLEGGEVGWRIVDIAWQACLNVRSHHDRDRLHGKILVRGPFRDEPAIGDQHLLLERDGERPALALLLLHDSLDAPVPGANHVNLAVLENLRRLGPGVPPHKYVRL